LGKAGRAVLAIFTTCIIFVAIIEFFYYLLNGDFLYTLSEILSEINRMFQPFNELVSGNISTDLFTWFFIFALILFIAAVSGAIARSAGGGFIAGLLGPLLIPIIALIANIAGFGDYGITYEYFYTDGLGLVIYAIITALIAAGVGALGKKPVAPAEEKPKPKPKPKEVAEVIKERAPKPVEEEIIEEEEILEEIEKL